MSEYIVMFGYEPTSTNTPELPIGEEIVRCRDCEHYMSGSRCNLQDEYNEFHWLDVEPDGFCKWPSKKNEE